MATRPGCPNSSVRCRPNATEAIHSEQHEKGENMRHVSGSPQGLQNHIARKNETSEGGGLKQYRRALPRARQADGAAAGNREPGEFRTAWRCLPTTPPVCLRGVLRTPYTPHAMSDTLTGKFAGCR